jgi:hypothetical protein
MPAPHSPEFRKRAVELARERANEAEKANFPIRFMCAQLGVSPSGFTASATSTSDDHAHRPRHPIHELGVRPAAA